MSLATLQQLRSFTGDEHPQNLEPGQIAFNMSTANFSTPALDYNMYMYVGNGTDARLDEGGTVLVTGGQTGKGWVRYRMRNVSVQGDNIYGDISVLGGNLKVESNGAQLAELIIPKETDTPALGTETGSVRWNTVEAKMQAWNGFKWDNTSKVTIDNTPPPNPSNGDLWMDPGPPAFLRVYVVPQAGAPSWVSATSSQAYTALQPGNGVTANAQNQIELINIGSY
jgi:hypothetical protein